MKDLKYRMYGLVPYQLSGIQKGIQFGHGVVEYSLKYGNTEEYKRWSSFDKTFIILNGGTTNHYSTPDGIPIGTLNKYRIELETNGISIETFSEPDLGNQLTAVVFLVDERVWDKVKYPDLSNVDFQFNWLQELNFEECGKITFLREFLSNLKLA